MSNKTPLLDEVLKYKKEENLIFSMPGNKCGKVFLKDNIGKEFVDTMGYLDITEVDPLDNLHAPEGIILEAQQLFLADLSSKLRSGEIDKATAKQLMEARRAEIKAQREVVKTEIQALKASFNLSPEVNKALMQTLKTAIAEENTALITETLNTIYSTLLTHIQFDYAKLAME